MPQVLERKELEDLQQDLRDVQDLLGWHRLVDSVAPSLAEGDAASSDAGRKALCGVYHARAGDIRGRYDWHADPAHRVRLKAFRLESVTITSEQYSTFATATGRPTRMQVRWVAPLPN